MRQALIPVCLFDTCDSMAVVDARLLAGKSGCDVVLQALRYSTRLMPIGVLLPLDRSLLLRQKPAGGRT